MDKYFSIPTNVNLKFEGKEIVTKAIHGSFSFELNDETQSLISLINIEAQKKYPRMHAEQIPLRFEKSWTGFIGEAVSKLVLKSNFSLELIDREVEIDSRGYDGGDIHFSSKGKVFICNCSSRKLSLNDSIENVIKNPQDYFVLIPIDQFKQYTSKCNLAFFVFIHFDKTSVITINVDDEEIHCYFKGKWIIPGYLKSSDLVNMSANSFLYVKKKGEKLKGLYSDLRFEVPMYTDNYVIFSNMLRSFKIGI